MFFDYLLPNFGLGWAAGACLTPYRQDKYITTMQYILIADGGSTKTDWCLTAQGKAVGEIPTKGMNPFQMNEEEMESELRSALLPQLRALTGDSNAPMTDVFFYGAGCTAEKQPTVERVLRTVLDIAGRCEVASDMLGAARGICGHQPGIACILGTGSNSCAYDGTQLTHNVSPLGFILGDEGSGAVLGRTLIGDVLKRQLPQPVIDSFEATYHLTNADIIERVYRQPFPNRFLASFAPFLKEHIDTPEIEHLVKEGFRSFLRRNVRQYDDWQTLPIGFNGSIAVVFRPQLEAVIAEEGMHLGRIIRTPMEGLLDYHAQ